MAMTALWWWIDRWRKSTAYNDLSLEAQAAYRNLLDEAWLRRGALPANERMLAKASGDATRWSEVREAVLAHFTLTPEGWRNHTLDAVLAQSVRRAVTQANYRARKNGHGHEPHNPLDNARDNNRHNRPDSPSPSPSLRSRSLVSKGKGAGKGKPGAPAGRNRICPHSPRCATWTGCTTLIVEEGRRRKAAGS